MKAILSHVFGGSNTLELVDMPVPSPGAHQVVIQVAAASVNPIDLSTREGRLFRAGLMPRSDVVHFGWDVAGPVHAVGLDVDRWEVGEKVIGLRDLLSAPGTHAEFVVLDDSALATPPASWLAEEAATLPLNGLTAWRSLDLAGLEPGQSVLITGASGGVGGFAVSLALHRELDVLVLARDRDVAHFEELGVPVVVTDSGGLGARIRSHRPGGVDAVVDAAALGIVAHEALRGEGRFVSVLRPTAPPPIRATTVVVQEVFADGATLQQISDLAELGVLRTRVADTFSLADIGAAHALVERGGLSGRAVLTP